MGGGVNASNAKAYLDAGASHVIVTSYVFKVPGGDGVCGGVFFVVIVGIVVVLIVVIMAIVVVGGGGGRGACSFCGLP